MKLREIVSQISIDPRKLIDYALDPTNQSGGADKAVLFQSCLGFTQKSYASLLEQIETQALDAEGVLGKLNQHGQRYQIDLVIIGSEERQEVVRTGWIVAPNSNVAKLTTLYVLRRRRR
ncbi:MAG: hypothetical protein LH702_09865 [Phormidesmis sp. CAN_BIN44]|nr:hypothetical protein [Phormidesmis sp. CAN_BIN44]